MPPPSPAELPDRVLLLTVSVPPFAMPPPSKAELPDRVLLLTVSVPPFAMPPPLSPAELPDRVLLLTVSVPKLRMAPPSSPYTPLAELPDRVLPVTVGVPALDMMYKPPPEPPPAYPLAPAGPPVPWLEAMVLEASVREPPFTYRPPPCALPPVPPEKSVTKLIPPCEVRTVV